MKKIIVFGSGNGSNFEVIIKYFQNKEVEFICVSDKKDAYILERAKKLRIKSFYVPFKETYDFLKAQKYDLIVLAGYMRILPSETVKLGGMINIHPSLLPNYKGKDVIKKAYDAGEKFTGVTVHWVNEDVDSGAIIAQTQVNIEENMSLSKLEEEVHKVEHRLYPRVIEHLLFNIPLNLDNITTEKLMAGGN